MSKRKPEWEDYNKKTTKKRTGKKKDDAGPSGLCGSITVQRMSADVEGKCQKYSRIGALTLAPIEEEVTFPNIKAACKEHFKTNLECDIWLVNDGLLTQMLAKCKTGKSYISDL